MSAIDFWGYNSHTSYSNPYKQSVPPNEDYAQADILTGITGITGDTYHIFYELNSYYDSDSIKNVQVGGLRVNKLSHTLPSGESLFTQYVYSDNNDHSTGEILSKSYMINFMYSSCGVYKTLSESPSDYYNLNGNFVGYSTVKTLNQNGGYTIFNFSNFSTPGSKDSLNYFPTSPYSIPDITSSISKAYKRGLLLSKIIYNASNDTISEDSNTYESLNDPIEKKAWAYHWANLSFSVIGSQYQNSCNFGASSTYWTNVENYRLTQSVHRDYDQELPDKYVQTTTAYTYSSNKRSVRSIATTDSRGLSHTQSFYYPDDVDIPMITTEEQTAVDALLASNLTDVVVHAIDNRNGVIHQVHNSYGTYFGYAERIYLYNTQYYTGSSLEKQQVFNYNTSTSQLISSHTSAGKPLSIQYEYHNSLPVARVINADNSEFFYEGFEENSSASTGNSHTGIAYYDGNVHGAYSVPFEPPSGKSYVIQWWSLGGGTWNMNEETYTGPRTISGSIDDIRVFPVDAQMTSYTYSPLVGKTSEIDLNGNTTRYEYDGLGRLAITRDNDGNIISKMCYHYAGQPAGCSLFYNHEKSQAFTKNNCSSGYTGSSVTYTVPDSIYLSTLNQLDADAKAQADIDANGQAYANIHGSCSPTTFTVYITNATDIYYDVELDNTATAQQYFYAAPGGGQQTTGVIPQGTYDIYLIPSEFTPTVNYAVGCGYYTAGMGGATVTFYNVPLSSGCNIIEWAY